MTIIMKEDEIKAAILALLKEAGIDAGCPDIKFHVGTTVKRGEDVTVVHAVIEDGSPAVREKARAYLEAKGGMSKANDDPSTINSGIVPLPVHPYSMNTMRRNPPAAQ